MAAAVLLTTVYLFKCRLYCLLGFGTDQLGKIHPILTTTRPVGVGDPSLLLVASISVVAPALLGVVYSVRAPMFLAERAMLLCLALHGLLGNT